MILSSEIYYMLWSEMWFLCFVLDQETFVISIKILDLISETTATAATAKNAWTEFVLKISKSHDLSQNRNSYIFCLLRKGTGPEGSICIIEIALHCHKQRCSRTDVNGIKILQLIFLMSHLFFFPHIWCQSPIYWGKGREGKSTETNTCYSKLRQKGERPLLLFI